MSPALADLHAHRLWDYSLDGLMMRENKGNVKDVLFVSQLPLPDFDLN